MALLARLPEALTITDSDTQEQHIFQDPSYGNAYDIMHDANYRAISDRMLKIVIKKLQEQLDTSEIPEGELAPAFIEPNPNE